MIIVIIQIKIKNYMNMIIFITLKIKNYSTNCKKLNYK